METQTLLDKTDRLPPFMTFALAREHGKELSAAVLAKRSGIPLRTFTRIAALLSWDDVKHGQVSRFAAACGVDLIRQSKQFEYLRKATKRQKVLSHLSPRRRSLLFKKMQEYEALKATTSPGHES